MVLAYTTLDFGATGKLMYACLTSIFLMTLYSANNTPYSAMTGVMTGDINERTRLSSYRFVAAMTAQLIVGGFTLPLVAKFGQGNNAKGWQMTMGLWATICVVLFVITFVTTRERISPTNAVQTAGALRGIRITMSVYPAAFFLIVIVCLTCYKIGEELNIQVQDELAGRRRKFATA